MRIWATFYFILLICWRECEWPLISLLYYATCEIYGLQYFVAIHVNLVLLNMLFLIMHATTNLPVLLNSCIFMQNHGYKHRNKSLEEILYVARKRKSELIGYNEDPIEVEADIPVEMKNLCIREGRNANISCRNSETSFIGRSKNPNQRITGDIKFDSCDVNNRRNNQPKLAMQNGCLRSEATEKINKKVYHGMLKFLTSNCCPFEILNKMSNFTNLVEV